MRIGKKFNLFEALKERNFMGRAYTAEDIIFLYKVAEFRENYTPNKFIHKAAKEFQYDLHFLLRGEKALRKEFVESLLNYFGDKRKLIYVDFYDGYTEEIDEFIDKYFEGKESITAPQLRSTIVNNIKTGAPAAFTIVNLSEKLKTFSELFNEELGNLEDVVLIAYNLNKEKRDENFFMNPVWSMVHEVIHNVYNTEDENLVQKETLKFLAAEDYTQVISLQYTLEFYHKYIAQTGSFARSGYSVYDEMVEYFEGNKPLFASILVVIRELIETTGDFHPADEKYLLGIVDSYLEEIDADEPLDDYEGSIYENK